MKFEFERDDISFFRFNYNTGARTRVKALALETKVTQFKNDIRNGN